MSTPRCTVVNLNVETFDVYGGRLGHGYDGWLGNPFKVGRFVSREKSIALHREYFLARVERGGRFRERVLGLRGKRIGCFCKPQSCHLDVVAEYVNGHFGD